MTKATQQLHELGQSIWLDNITRDLLTTGTLKRYVDELSVTGLTSIRRSSTMRSRTARPTTAKFAMASNGATPARSCSSSWLSKTS